MAEFIKLTPQQDAAANPISNVWVQANAGTGKTKVLVRRLLRILFRGGADDGNGILCLTYTNAGAGEMRNRILQELRDWAHESDENLRDLLSDISTNSPATDDDLAHARKIFYTFIDNPEILKIKTFHGFCEEILRRFPLEAGISPSWALISDAPQKILQQQAFEHLINTSSDPRTSDAFAHIVERVSEFRISKILDMMIEQYKYFFNITNIDKYRDYFIDTIKKYLNLTSGARYEKNDENLQKIADSVQIAINISKKPEKTLNKILEIIKQYIDNSIDFQKYKSAYLKADGEISDFVQKNEILCDEAIAVYSENQHIINQEIYKDTIALFDLAAAFAKQYRELKSQRNLLDFEDMILYTRRLFENPETMGWVLSQLNLRISHILVDEAQDTSPMQWDIMRMLAGDFFTDGDTNKLPHSLFVVGDTKQSIYGFQGADPNAFATSRQDIGAHIIQNLRTIQEIPLTQSFRSVRAILRTVDMFFSDPSVIAATGFANNSHRAFRTDSGFVEIYRASNRDSDVSKQDYIRNIADKITSLVESGKYAANKIMVLVQKREPFAPLLEKELKSRGIGVAGSDRITLPNFPAIRDLLNLVRFCINNSDNYSLCCVLKSPIFRLKEQDIFKICNRRIETNKSRKATDSDADEITDFDVVRDMYPEIYSRLRTMIQNASEMAPYTFFNNVLNTNNTRESIVAALGNQVVDPLEEFMTICLAYERTQSGTMRHFLKWFITGSAQIKRDLGASDGVRITTVHGAKGLESDVVFLIDTCSPVKSEQTQKFNNDALPVDVRAQSHLYPMPWLWTPHDKPSAQYNELKTVNFRDTIAESYRLLYVAMTRAKKELYIYGFSGKSSPSANSWYSMLWNVLCEKTNTPPDADLIRIADE